jgi:hypothetical protein
MSYNLALHFHSCVFSNAVPQSGNPVSSKLFKPGENPNQTIKNDERTKYKQEDSDI